MPLPPIDPERLTPVQMDVYRSVAGTRGAVRGPFTVMLHSPALAARLEKVGAYLRYESALPDRARELAIMTVARHYKCLAEWNSHRDIALRAGLSAGLLDDLAVGTEFSAELDSDHLVHRLVVTVLKGEELPQKLLDAVRALYGDEGVVDLNVTVGYYSLLAMMMNSFGVAADGPPAPWDQ